MPPWLIETVVASTLPAPPCVISTRSARTTVRSLEVVSGAGTVAGARPGPTAVGVADLASRLAATIAAVVVALGRPRGAGPDVFARARVTLGLGTSAGAAVSVSVDPLVGAIGSVSVSVDPPVAGSMVIGGSLERGATSRDMRASAILRPVWCRMSTEGETRTT